MPKINLVPLHGFVCINLRHLAQPLNLPDVLTTFSGAVAKTSTINLGTSIVPTYPRHPLVMAQQALALHDLALGNLFNYY